MCGEKMDRGKYRVLFENLLDVVKDLILGWKFNFQQDNDPQHT